MAVDPFVHPHVHTECSMLDGAAKVEALVAEAQRLGMPVVGMTDHGNMFGADEFFQQARKTGIKPIVGTEAHVAPHNRYHKKPVFRGEAKRRSTDEFGEGGDVSGAGAYTHTTMLAANSTGLRNLFTLSSRASFEGHYRKPRCFPPGQEIATRDGMKRIEELRIGDEVLTHRGRFREVTELMRNFHAGSIHGVRFRGGNGRVTWMTSEHPVLVRHADGTKSWVEAKDIAGADGRDDSPQAWVCFPRVRSDAQAVTSLATADFVDEPTPEPEDSALPEVVELDSDFGFLLSSYVAVGAVKGDLTTWRFRNAGLEVLDSCRKLIEKYTGVDAVLDQEAGSVSVRCLPLSRLLSALTSGDEHNQLPGFLFDAPESFTSGVLRGMRSSGASADDTTLSELSRWQLRGLETTLHPLGESVAAGDERATLCDEEFVYEPVVEVVLREYVGHVYNVEVGDDHSYVADFAVHNCDRELISEYAEGIIATTGCPSGEV